VAVQFGDVALVIPVRILAQPVTPNKRPSSWDFRRVWTIVAAGRVFTGQHDSCNP
jgi:hypothetical protein